MNKKLIVTAIVAASLLILSLLTRVLFFTYVDNYEFPYEINNVSGDMFPLTKVITKNGVSDTVEAKGYIFAWPLLESIHTIDTRPMQVCINANSRVLNCKLVEFDPKGFEIFVAWHGRNDYDEMRLKDILMSYAYDESSANYPFLRIMKELKNEDVTSIDTLSNVSITDSTLVK